MIIKLIKDTLTKTQAMTIPDMYHLYIYRYDTWNYIYKMSHFFKMRFRLYYVDFNSAVQEQAWNGLRYQRRGSPPLFSGVEMSYTTYAKSYQILGTQIIALVGPQDLKIVC